MLNAEELKELREVIGKAIGHDGPYTWGISDYIAVAEHFKAKTLEWLAKQCGEKPCRVERCDVYGTCINGEGFEKHYPSYCVHWQFYLGQQQGYAKGLAAAESRIRDREREIVEWLKHNASSAYDLSGNDLFQSLESWLGKESV